jgi:hypothetical protein
MTVAMIARFRCALPSLDSMALAAGGMGRRIHGDSCYAA